MDGTGALGASSCLCCDSRVRNVRDMQSMGFGAADRVFSPEKLPATEGLLPSITRSPDTASYNNAKLAHRKKNAADQLRKTAPTMVSEGMLTGGPRFESRGRYFTPGLQWEAGQWQGQSHSDAHRFSVPEFPVCLLLGPICSLQWCPTRLRPWRQLGRCGRHAGRRRGAEGGPQGRR